MSKQQYPTIESTIGHTPLVRLQRMLVNPNSVVLAKLEGNNPAGSVKDRPAMSMIREAEARGLIKPGDTIIEATSGNTGIALAMAAAIRGYRLILIMPSHMSSERKLSMAAYGAELIEVTQSEGMEGARDLAAQMAAAGEGIVLDQFANPDNPLGHVSSTGPEVWKQTHGEVTHFVSSMGTTGTIMGVSSFLKAKNQEIQIVGLQPIEGSQIPGIRRWPEAYRPKIFDANAVDRVVDVSQSTAEETMRRMAREEGIFAGVSSGASIATAIEIAESQDNVTVVAIVCDRGDRYLSTGVYS
ncbi:MAG: cysteine synthase B [Halieaceae bacterium]|nr:cysteine synthase B [Halieaceae bacterium]